MLFAKIFAKVSIFMYHTQEPILFCYQYPVAPY
jgi:hypothetical protein